MKRSEKKRYKVLARSATKTTAGLKRTSRQINWKLIGEILGLTVLLVGFYQFAMRREWAVVMWIYYAALLILLVAFLILNRGLSRAPFTPEQLPDDWSDEKKAAFVARDVRNKAIARRLLVFLLPLLFNFVIETAYLFYLDPLVESLGRYALNHS